MNTTTIDSLYAEIRDIDMALGDRESDADSAAYWREAAQLRSRQRDLWREIAKAAVGAVPDWARRAAFQAADFCAEQADRYGQFARQCEV